MSRIDEALKRSSQGSTAERVPARAESVLEHYPQEGRPQPTPLVVETRPATQRRVSLRSENTQPKLPTDPDVAAKLVIGDRAPAVFVEQYRRLAATMHELQEQSGLKTLLVTSAVPREGKTLTVVNLALTLSESYARRVLLIDADLRRPTVHEVLRLSNTVGLTDVLRSDRGALPVQNLSRNLTVLTAGKATSNPMAALTSDRMTALLEEAAAEYDWVLMDAPPVGIMPDAGLLAAKAGGCLLVVGARSTPFAMVSRAISELGRDRIVGTVLNRIAEQDIPTTGYYDGYYESGPQ